MPTSYNRGPAKQSDTFRITGGAGSESETSSSGNETLSDSSDDLDEPGPSTRPYGSSSAVRQGAYGGSCSASSGASSDSSSSAISDDAEGPATPHRLVKLRAVLLLVLQQSLTIIQDQTRKLSREGAGLGIEAGRSNSCELGTSSGTTSAVDRHQRQSNRIQLAARRKRTVPLQCDAAMPWSGLALSLVDLSKTLGGGNLPLDQGWDSRAYECCQQLVQDMLHVHVAPMTADKTYTRSLSRAEARAAIVVAKVISTAPAFSVMAPALPEAAGPAKDESVRAYDPGDLHSVILLRFAASALQPVPLSQNSADGRGCIRKTRRKTLDLSRLHITGSAGPAIDALATLDWRGAAAMVGLDLDEVDILNLGHNGMTDSDVARIDLACLPNLTVIDISRQSFSAIPLRWLISRPRAAPLPPSSPTTRLASAPSANTRALQTQTPASIRGIRVRARKTACLLTDTSRDSIADNNQEIMHLSVGRIRHDILSTALRAGQRDSLDSGIESSFQALRNEAGRRADGAGRGSGSGSVRNQGTRQTRRPRLSASFAAVQRAACGAKSLLLIAAVIAAEQYLDTSAWVPSIPSSPSIDRPGATRVDAQESSPSEGGMQPGSESCSSIGMQIELELEPYRALPPQLYKLITTAYQCDLCARIAFPAVGDSYPQFIASDIRVAGMADPVYFAYPADTRYPDSRQRERGERSDRHRYTANGGNDDNRNDSATGCASEGVITRALIQAMGNAASSTSASASAVEHVRVKGRVCFACARALVVLAKK